MRSSLRFMENLERAIGGTSSVQKKIATHFERRIEYVKLTEAGGVQMTAEGAGRFLTASARAR